MSLGGFIKDFMGVSYDSEGNVVSGMAADQKHYQIAEVQPIEIMQMYLTPEEFRGYLKGNIIKYMLRLGYKDAVLREVDKACQYMKWLSQAILGKKIDPRE